MKNKEVLTPLVLCIDEAHQFINKKMQLENDIYDLNCTSTIAKEGRKYGLHLCIATQRPRDIPEDILSQIGFVISHRLTNDADKNLLKSAVSGIDDITIKALPILPSGHAFCFSPERGISAQIVVDRAQETNRPISNDISFQYKDTDNNL